MNAAQSVVAAFEVSFGVASPQASIELADLGCSVLSLEAKGGSTVAVIADAVSGKTVRWTYTDPDTWVPDPTGSVIRTMIVVDDDDNAYEVAAAGRDDPVAAAQVQLVRFLEYIRG